MLEAILLLAVIVIAIMLQDTRQRLKRNELLLLNELQRREADWQPALQAEPESTQEFPASEVTQADRIPDEAVVEEVFDAPQWELIEDGPAKEKTSASQRFEALVGGRLPIWIGGIALAFAGFFLVRYSIELGLFGPGARSILAAAFGLILLALSEFGAKFPRLGGFVASDKRIPQSLAGAGIATLYGTLYMASELYGLIGIGMAFVLVVVVTVLALALSLRHGPPTAVMGLAGGYLAPLVAGLPDTSLTSTLLYLGVFTLGLTGLAVWRGWSWLAFAASIASLVWTGSLLGGADDAALWSIGTLIAVNAIAAMIALTRIGTTTPTLWGFRSEGFLLPPLAFGIVQLVSLAVMADFSSLSWLLLAALGAATIILTWRRELPASGLRIAFALGLFALLGSFLSNQPTLATLLPAIGLAVLFAGPALLAVYRRHDALLWAQVGIMAVVAPLLIAILVFADPVQDARWTSACAVAALPIYAILRMVPDVLLRRLAVAALLLLSVMIVGFALPDTYFAIGCAALFAGFAYGQRNERDGGEAISLVALIIAMMAMLIPSANLLAIALNSWIAETAHYSLIPPIRSLILDLALPSLVIAASARRIAMPVRVERASVIIAGLGLLGFAYSVLKQPLAIDTVQDFINFGFIERALLTQVLFIAGLWMASRRSSDDLHRLGLAACGLALLRFVWFDLLLLNPVAVEQAVGPTPIANMATVHAAAIAIECWLLARFVEARQGRALAVQLLRYASLAIMVIAALVTVRQGVHGSIIAGGDIKTAENYMYSAALLLLSQAWLAVGIRHALALLRIAGLVLLTAVTFKVFLVDAASLSGLLRVLSFLGLGAALIGIGWAYGKLARAGDAAA